MVQGKQRKPFQLLKESSSQHDLSLAVSYICFSLPCSKFQNGFLRMINIMLCSGRKKEERQVMEST